MKGNKIMENTKLEEISLRAMLKYLLQKWKILAFGTILCVFLSGIYCFFIKEQVYSRKITLSLPITLNDREINIICFQLNNTDKRCCFISANAVEKTNCIVLHFAGNNEAKLEKDSSVFKNIVIEKVDSYLKETSVAKMNREKIREIKNELSVLVLSNGKLDSEKILVNIEKKLDKVEEVGKVYVLSETKIIPRENTKKRISNIIAFSLLGFIVICMSLFGKYFYEQEKNK